MSEYITEVHTDHEDGIYLFQLDGRTGRVRWAEEQRGTDGADLAAMDFAGIAVQCLDPVTEGWQMCGFESQDEAQQLYSEKFYPSTYTLVASTDLYQGREVDMLVREDPEDWGEYTAKRFVRSFLGEE